MIPCRALDFSSGHRDCKIIGLEFNSGLSWPISAFTSLLSLEDALAPECFKFVVLLWRPGSYDRLAYLFTVQRLSGHLLEGSKPDDVRRDLWADPSQGVQRALTRRTPPTLCQTSMPYSFEHDCLLSGHDCLALQGIPDPFVCAPLHEFSDREARSLAGEAFFLPSAMSVILPYYLNPQAPWAPR